MYGPGGGAALMLGTAGVAAASVGGDCSDEPDDELNNPKRLYHGTDADSADDIVANGLDRDAAIEKGGGDVFWLTEDINVARLFAHANPSFGTPAIVGVDLSKALFDSFERQGVIRFDPQNQAWQVVDWETFNEFTEFYRAE